MAKGYQTVFGGIIKTVFGFGKQIVLALLPFFNQHIKPGATTYPAVKPSTVAAEEAIRQDYKKTGNDLFKAVNEYERGKGLKLTIHHQ